MPEFMMDSIETKDEEISSIFDSEEIMTLWDHYKKNKPIVNMTEFREDVNRFVYVKRLIRRYKNTGELNVRLLLNHLIVLYNVFDHLTTSYIIKSSNEEIHDQLFGILKFLNRISQDDLAGIDIDYAIIHLIEKEIHGSKPTK